MNKIKVVYLIDEINIGGTENQLLKQIRLLDDDLFDQSIICLRHSKYLETFKPPCMISCLDVEKLISRHGIHQLFKLGFMLKSSRTDILQSYFIDSNIFGALAGKIGQVGNIIACRRDMGFWYTKKILFVFKFIDLLISRYLVNAESIKFNMLRFEKVHPGKIDVIHNGIDLDPFMEKRDKNKISEVLKINKNDIVIGMVANLNRTVKRVDRFIEAATHVLRNHKNVIFMIIGDGHLRPSLEELAKKMNIHNNIYFVGQQEEVVNFLNIIDVGVLTSESEGLSNSILEYMAAGLPVVCSDVEGNRELVEHGRNGFLFQAHSVNELANYIGTLVEDKALRVNMGNLGLIKVESFSWSSIISKLENYYLQICNQK